MKLEVILIIGVFYACVVCAHVLNGVHARAGW